MGPYDVSVLLASMPASNEYGDYNEVLPQIRVSDDIGEQLQRAVLFHEMLHAAIDIAGLGVEISNEMEEKICTRAAPYLFDALRRNRRLRDYLFGAQ